MTNVRDMDDFPVVDLEPEVFKRLGSIALAATVEEALAAAEFGDDDVAELERVGGDCWKDFCDARSDPLWSLVSSCNQALEGGIDLDSEEGKGFRGDWLQMRSSIGASERSGVHESPLAMSSSGARYLAARTHFGFLYLDHLINRAGVEETCSAVSLSDWKSGRLSEVKLACLDGFSLDDYVQYRAFLLWKDRCRQGADAGDPVRNYFEVLNLIVHCFACSERLCSNDCAGLCSEYAALTGRIVPTSGREAFRDARVLCPAELLLGACRWIEPSAARYRTGASGFHSNRDGAEVDVAQYPDLPGLMRAR